MTAKEWLKKGRKLNQEIQELQEQKKNAFNLACNISMDCRTEKVQASKGNGTEEKFATYSEYSMLLDDKIKELFQHRKKMIDMIGKVENTNYRILLTAYYVNCNTWSRVAQSMNYDLRWVHRLHAQALKAIESHYDTMI